MDLIFGILVVVVICIIGFLYWKKKNPTAADNTVTKAMDEIKADAQKVKDAIHKATE